MLTWHFFIVSTPSSPCSPSSSSSSSVVSNNLSISLVSSLVINHFLQVFKTLPNFLVCCIITLIYFFQGYSVHDHLDKSPRARPSFDQTSPYSSWHRFLLAHEGHVEVQDGKLLALLLKRAGVGKGSWQLKAPFSCWNISYQLLWFCCLTRNLINSGVCKKFSYKPYNWAAWRFPIPSFSPSQFYFFQTTSLPSC